MADYQGRGGRHDMRGQSGTARTEYQYPREGSKFWRYFFRILILAAVAVVVVFGTYRFIPSSRPVLDVASDIAFQLKDNAVKTFYVVTGNGGVSVQPKPPIGPTETK